jgi:hypothetical protein
MDRVQHRMGVNEMAADEITHEDVMEMIRAFQDVREADPLWTPMAEIFMHVDAALERMRGEGVDISPFLPGGYSGV